MEKNPYQPIEAKLLDVITETSNIKTFVLQPLEDIGCKTGKFMEESCPGVGEAPFTPSSSPFIKEKLEFTIMKAGSVTAALHDMKPGTILGLRGPFGKGYPLEDFEGKDVLIVGGGVGLAPLRSLLLTLLEERKKYKKILLNYGAKTPNDIVYKGCVCGWCEIKPTLDVRLTVDSDDNNERPKGCGVGLVTTTCDDLPLDPKKSIAIVCGPPIMMKFTTLKLLDCGYVPKHIYLSMEKNMSCGLGICGHCMLDKYFCCKDGPVFTYEQLKDIPDIWA